MLPVTLTIPLMPFLSITLGLSLLVWVIGPILSFQLFYAKSTGIVTPLSDEGWGTKIGEPTVIDYSKASNWFPKHPTTATEIAAQVPAYTISVPKLRIANARVTVGTDDLSQSLIHYGASGIPGRYGNAVIFGHSILPQFYDPANYLSIFSLLPRLKGGDDIFIQFDGVDYRFEVVSTRVTTPQDVAGLEQRYDDSYVTLVTCVPPGTYFERLWVTAKQKPFGSGPS